MDLDRAAAELLETRRLGGGEGRGRGGGSRSQRSPNRWGEAAVGRWVPRCLWTLWSSPCL